MVESPREPIRRHVEEGANTFTVSYGTTTRTFPIKTASALGVVIVSLLPNPVGSDEELEEVELKNKGSEPASLAGWRLRDRSGREWTLTGTLAPDQSVTIRRNGMPMSLNNGGDTIALVDAANQVRDEFDYVGSAEGVAIQTGH